MERKPLPIGLNNFKKIIDDNYYFIDKTLMIKEIYDRKSSVFLFPRPRRFGKTLNMHMMQCFFEKPISRPYNQAAVPLAYLFENKKIWQYETLRAEQGKYPVIALTFKDIKSRTWDECRALLLEAIAAEYRCHQYLLEGNLLDEHQKTVFKNIMAQQAPIVACKLALKNLSQYLQSFYKSPVVVLIDEYDAPIHAGYLNKYYQDVIDFIRDLFSAVLKDNAALHFGAITGILRTAREGIFSGLNNLVIFSMLDEFFADKFGFTQPEIDELLATYNMSQHGDIVRTWYNGYAVPGTALTLYNPWSVLNFVDRDAKIDSYWANTSDNALIKKQLTLSAGVILRELGQALLGNPITNRPVNEGLVFPGMERDETAVWSLLVFSGYLTVTEAVHKDWWYQCTLKIPNREVAGLYKSLLNSIVTTATGSQLTDILDALTTGDTQLFQKRFTTFFANMMSFYDIPDNEPERSYHLFFLGLLTPLSDTYEIRSNRESGSGRYDIMLEPRDRAKQGVIIEFKKVEIGTPEQVAQSALKQIKDKNYAAELRACGIQTIVAYGIAVDGKNVLIQEEMV